MLIRPWRVGAVEQGACAKAALGAKGEDAVAGHVGDDPGHVEPELIVRDNPHGNQDVAEIEPDGLGLDLDLISEAAAGDASSLQYNDSMSPRLSHPQGFDRLLALETLKRELICQGEGVVSTDAYCIWPR